MIRHIVMFQFKDDAGNKNSNIDHFKDKLDALKNKISEIVSFESGINFSQSPHAFDLVLESSFKSEEDLEKYKIHPNHKEVLVLLKEVVEKVHVVDYIF